MYCGIIIVRGCLMLVDFVGFPYPRIYVPMNVGEGNELSCIVMLQTSYPRNYVATNQQDFDNPRTLAPTSKNDSTVFKS